MCVCVCVLFIISLTQKSQTHKLTQGYMIDYLDAVLNISDIGAWNYTHRSRASSVAYPSSSYTAAAYDIQHRISCLGGGPFWITTERLKMTAFTTPLTIYKIRLFIKSPLVDENNNGTFVENIFKILSPFDTGLWISFFVSLLLVAIMKIWFAEKDGEKSKWWHLLRSKSYKEGSFYYRVSTLLFVFFDSIIATFIDAFGQSVSFDINGSTSQKILNLGFGFLVLVILAGYTANLAAFLTRSNEIHHEPYVSDMIEATSLRTKICAPAALKSNLLEAWPNAAWVFVGGGDYFSTAEKMIYNFDNGICEGIVESFDDLLSDPYWMVQFCDRDLVYTDSVVLNIPAAIPACEEYVAGISYWIKVAEHKGIKFKSFLKSYQPQPHCDFSLKSRKEDDSDDDQLKKLTPGNFLFPFLCLAFCGLVATILQLRHHKRIHHRHSKLSLKKSTLRQVEKSIPKTNDEILKKLLEIQNNQIKIQNDQNNLVKSLVTQKHTTEKQQQQKE